MNTANNILGYLKSHPLTCGLLGMFSGSLGVWFAENAHLLSAYSATLLSLGSFIVISPKVFAQLREYKRTVRLYRRRLTACFLRTYRARKHRKERGHD